MSDLPTQSVVELTAAEVEIVLHWCNAADFESRVDTDELPLVDKLATAVGDDPERHAQWAREA